MTEENSAAYKPLGKLPVFFALNGRSCVLAGDNADALPKLRLLVAAGGKVSLFITGDDGQISAYCDSHTDQITRYDRSYTLADLQDALLAIGAFEDEAAAKAFAALAHEAGTPVNLVDRPALCDFQVPSIVNRTPFIVGISTGGIAPVVGQWLRGRVETLLPPDAGRILQTGARLRGDVLKRLPRLQDRRRFWRRVAEDDLAALSGADEQAILKRLTARLEEVEAESSASGALVRLTVDNEADNLRLGQLRALQNADAVFSMAGIAPLYVDFVRRDADRVLNADTAALPEALAAAADGKSVIWLELVGESETDLAGPCAAKGIRFITL